MGSFGPLYGPYTIEKNTQFKTTDIPAGKFDGIGFLYSAEKLTSDILDMLRLPDAQFKIATSDSNNGPSLFVELIDGRASGVLLENQTIVQGEENTFNLTLIPLTGSKTTVSISTGFAGMTLPSTDSLKRTFISLRDIQTGAPELSFALTTVSGSIGTVLLYDDAGKSVSNFLANRDNPQVQAFLLASPSKSHYYAYIEYQATDLILFCTAGQSTIIPVIDPVPVPVLVTYTVTFDSQGATVNAFPGTKTVTTPAETTIDALPTNPTKSGARFVGWRTLPSGAGTQFTGTTPVTADVTVYAYYVVQEKFLFATGGLYTLMLPPETTSVEVKAWGCRWRWFDI